MKLKLLFIILLSTIFCSESIAFTLGGSNFGDTSATRSYVKYAPQQYNYNYNNRFMKQKKNYIYSPQQAKYYGYRVPQQQSIPSYRYMGQ